MGLSVRPIANRGPPPTKRTRKRASNARRRWVCVKGFMLWNRCARSSTSTANARPPEPSLHRRIIVRCKAAHIRPRQRRSVPMKIKLVTGAAALALLLPVAAYAQAGVAAGATAGASGGGGVGGAGGAGGGGGGG